jgi:hypothetical protein
MRPTYETEQDQSRERQIVERMCQQSGLRAVKLPQFEDVDFALLRGEQVWGVVEIKCRGKHYPEMFLSLKKCQALRDYAASGLQSRVIFATPEGVYSKKIGPLVLDGWIGIGGRKDRNDPKDVEMVCFFSVNGKEESEPMKRVCDSDSRWFQ